MVSELQPLNSGLGIIDDFSEDEEGEDEGAGDLPQESEGEEGSRFDSGDEEELEE